MAQIISFNGSSYTIPDVNDTDWGQNVTDFLVAIPNGVLQPTGGLFSLSADVDFGANFGLESIYYKSRTANIAQSGIVRLARVDSVVWRNQANGADLALAVNASDQLMFNGVVIESDTLPSGDMFVGDAANSSTARTISGAWTMSNVGVATLSPNYIVNSMINSAAAIDLTKLAALTADRVMITNASGVIVPFGWNISGDNIKTSNGGRLHFVDDVGAEYVGIGSPTAVTTYNLYWPAAAGSPGEYLSYQAGGQLQWLSPVGSGTVNSGVASYFAYYPATNTTVDDQILLSTNNTDEILMSRNYTGYLQIQLSNTDNTDGVWTGLSLETYSTTGTGQFVIRKYPAATTGTYLSGIGLTNTVRFSAAAQAFNSMVFDFGSVTNGIYFSSNIAGTYWNFQQDGDIEGSFDKAADALFSIQNVSGNAKIHIEAQDADKIASISFENSTVTHTLGIETTNDTGGGAFLGPASSLNIQLNSDVPFYLGNPAYDARMILDVNATGKASWIGFQNFGGVQHRIGIETETDAGGGTFMGIASSFNIQATGNYPVYISTNGQIAAKFNVPAALNDGTSIYLYNSATATNYQMIRMNPSSSTINEVIVGYTDFAGGINELRVRNLSNTAGSRPLLTLWGGGSSAGDPTLRWTLPGLQAWYMGIDNSVTGDPLVISNADGFTNRIVAVWEADTEITSQFNSVDDIGLDIIRNGEENDDTWLRINNSRSSPTAARCGIQLRNLSTGTTIGSLVFQKYPNGQTGTYTDGRNVSNSGSIGTAAQTMANFTFRCSDFTEGFYFGSNVSGTYWRFYQNGAFDLSSGSSQVFAINSTGYLRLRPGSNTSPTLANKDDTDTGIYFSGTANIDYAIAGGQLYKMNTNYFGPVSDGQKSCGQASTRWSDVRSVLINGADYGFQNGWIIREYPCSAEDVFTKSAEWMKEHSYIGIQFLNKEKEMVVRFELDGTIYANSFKTFDGFDVVGKIKSNAEKIEELEKEIKELKEAA